jgi:surface protein
MTSCSSNSNMSSILKILLVGTMASAVMAQYVVDDTTIQSAVAAYLIRMRSGILDSSQNEQNDIATWDTSRVTSMALLFEGASDFNADISAWDVRKVTSLRRTFKGCSSFNADISQWDIRKVQDLSDTFNGATLFSQDISSWDTQAATTMARMFMRASLFMKDISNFDTSNVVDMSQMFMVSLCGWGFAFSLDAHTLLSLLESAAKYYGKLQWDWDSLGKRGELF